MRQNHLIGLLLVLAAMPWPLPGSAQAQKLVRDAEIEALMR